MARIATNHAIDYKRKKLENEELSLCKETEENIKSSQNIEDLLLTKEQNYSLLKTERTSP